MWSFKPFGSSPYKVLREVAVEKLRIDGRRLGRDRPIENCLQEAVGDAAVHLSTVRGFKRLATRLKVPIGHLRWDLPMHALFGFTRAEFGDRASDAWEKLHLDDRFEPFAYDLLEVLEKHSDHKRILQILVSRGISPQSEDAWIDWINTLCLSEFAKIINQFPKR